MSEELAMPYAMKPLSCDPARIKAMSERLIISRATVTGLLDSLEKRGYVIR